MQAVSELAEDWTAPWNGKFFPKGSKLILTSLIEIRKNKQVGLPIPNAAASCLNISKRCWDEAREIRKKSKIDSSIKKTVSFSSDEEAIDYLELMMQSVVFAFTALEAFVNEMIPDDYVYEKQGRKCDESYKKKDIERWLTIDEKYGKVLPEVLAIESPKGKHRSWSDLQKLKKVRDRLIHMKSDDRKSSGPELETIWSELVTAEPPYKESFAIISYFISKTEVRPRWYKEGKSLLNK